MLTANQESLYEGLPYPLRLLCSLIQHLLVFLQDSTGSLFLQADYLAKQSKITPLVQEARDKYSDNWLKREEEIRKIQQAEGVSPLAPLYTAGILFIQIPILIAVAKVISSYPGLSGQPFMWISDLSQPEKLMLLPFSIPVLGNQLMLAVSIATPLYLKNHAENDIIRQRSRKSNLWISVLFFVLLYQFPAGLILYWTCANFISTLQMSLITKSIRPMN
jgi:YidC/Oxa1 family membrane protein insertase